MMNTKIMLATTRIVKQSLGLLSLLTGLLSCITPFQPDPVRVDPMLIVDGQITDQPGPYTIRLTRTSNYSIRSVNLLEPGATVVIADNLGNQETLKEQSPGAYTKRVPTACGACRADSIP